MALGLLLAAAGVRPSSCFFGTRLPRSEIRVTVTRDALPAVRNACPRTLHDTPGRTRSGRIPATARTADREDAANPPAMPATAPAAPIAIPSHPAPKRPPNPPRDRTIVQSDRADLLSSFPPSPARAAGFDDVPIGQATVDVGPVARPIAQPFRSPLRADRRRGGRRSRARGGPARERPGLGAGADAPGRAPRDAEVLDRVAGPDSHRRECGAPARRLVEAMAENAVREPVTTSRWAPRFWDSFTSTVPPRSGRPRIDGLRLRRPRRWVDTAGPLPTATFRRPSPTSASTRGGSAPGRTRRHRGPVRRRAACAEELLAAAGPTYEMTDVRELVGERAAMLRDLWLAWDAVKPAFDRRHRRRPYPRRIATP